jgi:hypothetical protein
VGEQRVVGVTDEYFVSDGVLRVERVLIYYYIRDIVKSIQLQTKQTISFRQRLP